MKRSAARRVRESRREPAFVPRADRAGAAAHYAPAGALVDERGDILYLHGRTGQYLEPAPGEAGMNILKMAREGLRRELTTALHKAVAQESRCATRASRSRPTAISPRSI